MGATEQLYSRHDGAVRLTLIVLAAVALVSCSSDSGREHAAAVTTTSTSRPSCSLPSPKATDGSAAKVLARRGELQVAVVDHGASVDVVSLFAGCDAAAVTLDGSAAAFPIGGTVTHGDGLRCTAAGITALSATSDDGVTYQATTTEYRLRGATLVRGKRTASTIEAQRDPDTLRAYYELSC
jgi:hypothetical protein